MKYIGAHVSIAGGVSAAPVNAAAIGARAFALFTGSSQRWKVADPSEKECALFRENCNRLGFTPKQILPHSGFLINLGSPDPQKRAMSKKAFDDELRRCSLLGLTMLNFHPGASLKAISDEECLNLIADGINASLEKSEGVTAVIENTAGQGSNLGWSLDHLAYLIDKVDDKSRVGVCIDTCHAFAAGLDFSTAEGYERTWAEFDEKIGTRYLRGMHLNDAKRKLGSRIDRHEQIGDGLIGREFFARLIADPRTDDIPLILETPDDSRWAEEIAMLYGFVPEQ